jgi:SAM-dependent methyltransferase
MRNGGPRDRLIRRIPFRVRRQLRLLERELPLRARDSIPDFLDALKVHRQAKPLPPPHLRRRVAGTSSRKAFLQSGEDAARDIFRVCHLSRDPVRNYPAWLDFGCGCGRVSRFFAEAPDVKRLTGVDVDGQQVDWCRSYLHGDYSAIPAAPPTALAGEAFDVVYAGSVFTHLDEAYQNVWLREIHRVLNSGGLLISTTHSPELIWTRPDLTADQRSQLKARGFLFADGNHGFNEKTAFHARDYLLGAWGSLFGLLRYECFGLNRYQDLHVWQKW